MSYEVPDAHEADLELIEMTTPDALEVNFSFITDEEINLLETIDSSDGDFYSLAKDFIESISSDDTISKSSQKTLTESQIVSDSIIKELDRLIEETINSSDGDIYAVERKFTEIIGSSDDVLRESRKLLSELQTIEDVLESLGNRISFSESQTMSDTISFVKHMTKILTETIEPSDTLNKSVQRDFEDNQDVLDGDKRSVNKDLFEALESDDSVLPLVAPKLYKMFKEIDIKTLKDKDINIDTETDKEMAR